MIPLLPSAGDPNQHQATIMATNLADLFDDYLSWIALFFLLVAINLAMEAGAYLLADSAAEQLRSLALWPARASSVVMAIVAVLLIRVSIHKRRQNAPGALDGGYVTETVKRSATIACFLTLFLVGILDVVTNTSQLPADFFIKLPGVMLTAGYSIPFFLLNSVGTSD